MVDRESVKGVGTGQEKGNKKVDGATRLGASPCVLTGEGGAMWGCKGLLLGLSS